MKRLAFGAALLLMTVTAGQFTTGCEKVDAQTENHPDTEDVWTPASVPLDELAGLFASLPLTAEQMQEVQDAVSASTENGYDEEYRLTDLFAEPGRGVGQEYLATKAPTKTYALPLREMIADQVRGQTPPTKASLLNEMDPEAYLAALEESDAQLYWPGAEHWDGKTLPVITFDPGDASDNNVGYRLTGDGIEVLTVTEELAEKEPVWVLNRNDDAQYQTLDVLRKNDPEWGIGGSLRTKGNGDDGKKMLRLRTFRMLKQYDTWFRGASEFFVRAGAVEDFTASTEAEMKLYNPSLTDFVVVVRRGQIGAPMKVNTVLVSEWTDQLDRIALMITEDDGGTRTSWKCSAIVKVYSKSFGFDVDLPYRSYDDIVWRGQLARSYIERYNGKACRFGGLDLTFEFD